MMAPMEVQVSAESHSGGHLERFDPEQLSGRLIDAEHRGRYWWAAQLAPGRDVLDAACGTGYGSAIMLAAGAKSVTGVDVSPEAVATAARVVGEGGTVLRGDVRELPVEDDSFDLAVCWETIEHVEDGERAIAEFRRALRPEGILLVSSPNPDVYPEGNEHHLHEYRPQELAALAGEFFDHVTTFRQHPWVASAIEPSEVAGEAPRGDGETRPTRAVANVPPGGETYSIVVASDAPLPSLEESVTLGDAFEVKWWNDELLRTRRLLAQEEARRADAEARMHEASAALLEANQALVQMPVLRHRLEETHQRLTGMESSISWRITAPLRRLRRLQGR